MATCATTVPHYYVGTVGLEILLDTGIDLSEATAVSILVRREGGTETTWSAETYTEDGATTKVRHTTVSGDLDEAGSTACMPGLPCQVAPSPGPWPTCLSKTFMGEGVNHGRFDYRWQKHRAR